MHSIFCFSNSYIYIFLLNLENILHKLTDFDPPETLNPSAYGILFDEENTLNYLNSKIIHK